MAGPSFLAGATTQLLNALAGQTFAIRASHEVGYGRDSNTNFDIIGTTNQCRTLGTILVAETVYQTKLVLRDTTGNAIGNGNGKINVIDRPFIFSVSINGCQVTAQVERRSVKFIANPYPCNLDYFIRCPATSDGLSTTVLSASTPSGSCLYATLHRRESAIIVELSKNCPLPAICSILIAALREYYCSHKMHITPLPNAIHPPLTVEQVLRRIKFVRIRSACRDTLTRNCHGANAFGQFYFDLFEDRNGRSVLVAEVNREEVNFCNSIGERLFYSRRNDGTPDATVYLQDGEALGKFKLGKTLDSTATLVGLSMPYFKIETRNLSGYGCRKDQITRNKRYNLDIVAAIAEPRVVAQLKLEDFTVKVTITDQQPCSKSKILLLAYCTHVALFYYRLPEQIVVHAPYTYGKK